MKNPSYYVGEGYPFSRVVDQFNERWKDEFIIYVVRKSRSEAFCAYCVDINKLETTVVDLLAQDKQEFIAYGRRLVTFYKNLKQQIDEFNTKHGKNQTVGIREQRADGTW